MIVRPRRDGRIGKRRSDAIESLRAVAALMVIFFHLTHLAQLPLPAGLQIIRTHFGLGVPLFYTLSGFVLAYGYADKLENCGVSSVSFLVRRFFRIAPLFYTVLVAWRVLGGLLWSSPLNRQSLFLNLTFLFGLVPGEHESLVMGGWSIGIEMLFYVIFPILIVLLRGVRSSIFCLALCFGVSAATSSAYAAAGLNSYAYMNLVTQMPFFIAGILCFRVLQIRISDDCRDGWVGLAAALALTFCMLKDNSLYGTLKNAHFGALEHNIWSIIFGSFIYAVCRLNPRFLNTGVLPWFGRMSFSMYLLHPIVMVAVVKSGGIAWVSSFDVWSSFLIGGISSLVLICAVSYASYRWIELPGMEIGKILLSKLEQKHSYEP